MLKSILIKKLIDFFQQEHWAKKMSRSNKPDIVSLKHNLIKITHFLPEDASLKQRAWHIQNDNYSIPRCENCKKEPVKFHRNRYLRFCSKKCSANAETSKTKVKQTNLKRYGVEYGAQSPEIRKKMEQTNLSKYGYKSSLSSPIVRKKIKKTMMETYGTPIPFQSNEIAQKRKASMIQKYGTTHALQNNECLGKMQTTMQKKYGTLHALQNNSIKQKAIETHKKRYNRQHSKQTHIPEETLLLLEDREFLKNLHHKEKMSMIAMGERLGVSETTIAARLEKFNISKINHFVSQQELEFEKFFKKFNIKYLSNSRKIIPPFELDFYFPTKKLAIELNGLYWHSEHQKPVNYHFEKYKKCRERGVKLLQFFEDEIDEKYELIKQKILYELGMIQKSVYARKCKIREVSIDERKNFLNKYHIQGDARCSVSYGLEYEGELTAVLTFLQKNEREFILNRFATSCSVPGGFSRLLKYFEVKNNFPQLTTFADLRYSDGKLYKATGFTCDKQLKPDYFWVKGRSRYHKFNFRHNSGLKKLENYDSTLSEVENMHNHGFYKIYDAGKLRFVKNLSNIDNTK